MVQNKVRTQNQVLSLEVENIYFNPKRRRRRRRRRRRSSEFMNRCFTGMLCQCCRYWKLGEWTDRIMNVIIKLWVQTLGEGYVPKIKHCLVWSQWALRGTFFLEGIKNKVTKKRFKTSGPTNCSNYFNLICLSQVNMISLILS